MPITFDEKRKAWIVDDVSEVTGVTLNNMLKWGQPYNPYQSELFKNALYDSGVGEPPTIIFRTEDVLTNGFGQNVKLTDFDVLKNLRNKNTSLGDGTYSLKQLQDLGLSKTGDRGDHVIGTNLYLNQHKLGVSPKLGWDDAAYVFGSVLFQLSDDTAFTIRNGQIAHVDGNLGLREDNFDHKSKNVPRIVSVLVHGALGDDQNFDQVRMLFEGPGKRLTFRNKELAPLVRGNNDKKDRPTPGRQQQLKDSRQLHLNPTMRRLMSGDLSALDPENRPFSPNLLRLLMGGRAHRVKGATRLHDIARPQGNRFEQ